MAERTEAALLAEEALAVVGTEAVVVTEVERQDQRDLLAGLAAVRRVHQVDSVGVLGVADWSLQVDLAADLGQACQLAEVAGSEVRVDQHKAVVPAAGPAGDYFAVIVV